MERHQEQAPTSTALETSTAWAAGLFEGEGFLVERRVGRRNYLSLGMEMRDLDIMERFVAIAQSLGALPEERPGGPGRAAAIIQRKQRKIHNPKHSDIYRWVTTGHTAERVYAALRPYLGERRRTKADAILEQAHTIQDELRTARKCEECDNTFVLKDYGHGKRFCSKTCYYRYKVRQPSYRAAANKRNREYKARLRAKREIEGQTTIA